MNRTFFSCAGIAIVLSGLTGTAVRYYSNPNAIETFGEKTEWSLLQAVEFQERDKPLREPTIRLIHGSEVLGLRAMDGRNVWILLSVQSPPYYKQMPSINYEVSAEFVDDLVKKRHLSYTVAQVLRSHVTNR
jgi:hypothetical protein